MNLKSAFDAKKKYGLIVGHEYIKFCYTLRVKLESLQAENPSAINSYLVSFANYILENKGEEYLKSLLKSEVFFEIVCFGSVSDLYKDVERKSGYLIRNFDKTLATTSATSPSDIAKNYAIQIMTCYKPIGGSAYEVHYKFGERVYIDEPNVLFNKTGKSYLGQSQFLCENEQYFYYGVNLGKWNEYEASYGTCLLSVEKTSNHIYFVSRNFNIKDHKFQLKIGHFIIYTLKDFNHSTNGFVILNLNDGQTTSDTKWKDESSMFRGHNFHCDHLNEIIHENNVVYMNYGRYMGDFNNEDKEKNYLKNKYSLKVTFNEDSFSVERGPVYQKPKAPLNNATFEHSHEIDNVSSKNIPFTKKEASVISNNNDQGALSISEAINKMTNFGFDILSNNQLLDENGRITTLPICNKELFSAEAIKYCKKQYASLSGQSQLDKIIKSVFYASICASMYYYKEPNKYPDVFSFADLLSRVVFVDIDKIATKLLGISNLPDEKKKLAIIIEAYSKYCVGIINRVLPQNNRDLAVQDASESAYMIGMMYAMRTHEKNLLKDNPYIHNTAEQNQTLYGHAWRLVVGQANKSEGLSMWDKLSQVGFSEAAVARAMFCTNPADKKKLLELAVKDMNPEALWQYSCMIPHSVILDVNNSNDRMYLEYCHNAAKQGSVDAMNEMGNIYHRQKLYVKSMYWYVLANVHGHPDGKMSVAGLAQEWKRAGMPINEPRPNSDIEKARFDCALLYLEIYAGEGLSVDPDKVVTYVRNGVPIAGYLMGDLCEMRGDGQSALEMYRTIADHGDAHGAKCCADTLLKLSKMDSRFKNNQLIVHYIKKAADLGDRSAMFVQGEFSKDQDRDVAAYWYGVSHSRGYEHSLDRLLQIKI